MINIVLSLQSKLDEANKHVVEEIRKLSDAILKLQSIFSKKSIHFYQTDWPVQNASAGQMFSIPEGNV